MILHIIIGFEWVNVMVNEGTTEQQSQKHIWNASGIILTQMGTTNTSVSTENNNVECGNVTKKWREELRWLF